MYVGHMFPRISGNEVFDFECVMNPRLANLDAMTQHPFKAEFCIHELTSKMTFTFEI